MPLDRVHPRSGHALAPVPEVDATPDWSAEEVSSAAFQVLVTLLGSLPGAAGCCAFIPARDAAVFVFPSLSPRLVMMAGRPQAEVTAQFTAALPATSSYRLFDIPVAANLNFTGRLFVALPHRLQFGRLEREVMKAQAAHFVGCLNMAQLRSEAVKLRQSLGTAVQIHGLLANGLDMEDLLRACLEPITQMVNATGAGVMLYDPITEELVLQKPAFNIADGTLIDQYRVRVDSGQEPFTAVRVFLTSQPFINNEPYKNPHINHQFIRLFGVRNSATLPLRVDHRNIGVLHVINKREGAFTEDDCQLLTLVASQLAVLLENARLVMQIRRREQEAKLLYDIGIEVSNSLELDQILVSVAEKSRYLVRAELASISLLDPDTGYATVKVAVGDYTGTVRQVNFFPAGGTSAQILKDRLPVTRYLPGVGGDLDNLDLVARSNGFSTVLAVPLMADGLIFGLLHVWRRNAEPFACAETELLRRLSVQAAIALDKARQYQYQDLALAELRRLNGLIQSQHALLKQAQAVHREMTALVLEGKGHGSIAETLTRLVKAPVAVLDRFQRVLALTQPDSATVDEAWERLRTMATQPVDAALTAVLQEMAEELKPVLVAPAPPDGRELQRLMAPVVVEHKLLGYIAVLHNGQKFQELDFVAVEQAATVCALVMLKEKTALEVEYRLKGDLLFDLCRGRYPSEQDFIRRASVLGYDLHRTHTVLLLEFDPSGRGPEAAVNSLSRMRHLLDMVRSLLQEYAPEALVAAQGESVLILASAADISPKVLAQKLQGQVTTLLQQSISIGIGSACNALKQYTRSYKEARQALVTIRRQGAHGRVSAFSDLGIFRVLFGVQDTTALNDFVQSTLNPLLEYDQQHGSPLTYTLDQFLKHQGNRQATSKSIFVHINTLNYRLRRISEILNVSLDEHATRLNLDLALRVLESTDPGQLASPPKSSG